MSDNGHTPGDNDGRALTAQEVNLLQYNERQLAARVAELELELRAAYSELGTMKLRAAYSEPGTMKLAYEMSEALRSNEGTGGRGHGARFDAVQSDIQQNYTSINNGTGELSMTVMREGDYAGAARRGCQGWAQAVGGLGDGK